MYKMFGPGDGRVYRRGMTRNMEYLHSLALLVQLQTTPVSWDKAISVGMLYFILVDARTLTPERKESDFEGERWMFGVLESGRCKAEATERRKREREGGR